MESILINLKRDTPAFEKQVKSIQSFITFLANPVTNENRKTHHRIGMYKKMNRVIENKKGFLLRVRNPPFVATDNENYVNKLSIWIA